MKFKRRYISSCKRHVGRGTTADRNCRIGKNAIAGAPSKYSIYHHMLRLFNVYNKKGFRNPPRWVVCREPCHWQIVCPHHTHKYIGFIWTKCVQVASESIFQVKLLFKHASSQTASSLTIIVITRQDVIKRKLILKLKKKNYILLIFILVLSEITAFKQYYKDSLKCSIIFLNPVIFSLFNNVGCGVTALSVRSRYRAN